MNCLLGGSVSDEIMHQDIVPLCAAEIEDELRKKFAYLSGKGLNVYIRFLFFIKRTKCWPVFCV